MVVDGEGVLAAGRLVDRLLADDRTQDDLGRGQGGHAYTSCMRASEGCSISTRSALIRSTTLSESARMTSTVGRLRAESSRFWSRPGRHDEDAAVGGQRPQHARELAGLDRLEPEAVDDLELLVDELGRQRTAQGEALHLARQALLVGARVRPEHHAAAAVVRRGDGALAGAAGALLAVRLLATAADLAAGLGVVRAGPPGGQLRGHDLVQHGGIHRGREELIAELDVADGLAGPVVQGGGRHRQAFFTRMSDPRAPGRLPLTSSRLRSGSVRTTRTFLIVTVSSPMWPAIFMPR